jgi:hypothetical protein
MLKAEYFIDQKIEILVTSFGYKKLFMVCETYYSTCYFVVKFENTNLEFGFNTFHKAVEKYNQSI